MKLNTIFTRPIDKAIDGVIKADDESSLLQELEEYVLTNETSKRLSDFLSAYNDYQGANGVWISGFFGSGKSHLLKMLALVLEDRAIQGTSAYELFAPKCEDDAFLSAELKKAISIPSKSVLFNIDQKADVTSKQQFDAVLAVFVKVFDEMSGYYGKLPFIAQFERDLDSRGLYQAFKEAFERIAGKPWHRGREQYVLEGANVSAAYAEVSGGDVESNVLSIYRSQYSLSIEDFANKVQDYIEQQQKKLGVKEFRLNFFVDEVGQYIADNVKLMTNLQTIAESLATKCQGRAWIVVTAQEDMSNVVGQMSAQQHGNDFSKIQARFSNRMKLTSTDVAEVIQKRLLTKTPEAEAQLVDIYNAQVNNFPTMFGFADGGQGYRTYQHESHFIYSYPFVPYQFDLFQSAIQSLSLHEAFEGKHSSVGERSMLGVFHQVLKHIGEHQLGQLATFDLMFEGITSALQTRIQQPVLDAQRSMGKDAFEVRLLKAMLLVKYVKNFKASVHNLSILMLDNFEQPIAELKEKVERALGVLEQHVYIERQGDFYAYLTDEEKDIEHEIKNTDVDTSELVEEYEKVVFEQILGTRKIRYDLHGVAYDYSFSRYIDNNLRGSQQELGISVITPLYEGGIAQRTFDNEAENLPDTLMVILPDDKRSLDDLLIYKRTAKYIRQNMSGQQNDAARRILTDKSMQNSERLQDFQQRVKNLVARAKLMIHGTEVEVSSQDPQTRIQRGFQELVTRVYTNLVMLRGVQYNEHTIAQCLRPSDDLIGGGTTALTEAEAEVYSFIKTGAPQGVRTTVKTVVERFEARPYGWSMPAILSNLAKLYARGMVECKEDSNLLEVDALEAALPNTRRQANIILELQEEFTAAQIRDLKDFYSDFFDKPAPNEEAKALAQHTIEALKTTLDQMEQWLAKQHTYPFVQALEPVIKDVQHACRQQYNWFLTDIRHEGDALLDHKEDVIDPIRRFFSGSQQQIYDEARQFLRNEEANFTYINGGRAEQLHSSLQDKNCHKGNHIQQIKTQLDELKAALNAELEKVKQQAKLQLSTLQARIHAMDEYQKLPEERQAEANKPFDELTRFVDAQHLIAMINDKLRNFEDNHYHKVAEHVVKLANPAPANEYPTGDAPSVEVREEPQSVPLRSLRVGYTKPWLASEEDVDAYLEILRGQLVEQVKQGRKITV